jgi:hypothetical protein|tara:strand:+ start:561 stop:785 length:225 start_codon:yes stop_codon:yes gene_type:complete
MKIATAIARTQEAGMMDIHAATVMAIVAPAMITDGNPIIKKEAVLEFDRGLPQNIIDAIKLIKVNKWKILQLKN